MKTYEEIREEALDMKPLEAANFLLMQLRLVMMVADSKKHDVMLGLRPNTQYYNVMWRLYTSCPYIVTNEQLVEALKLTGNADANPSHVRCIVSRLRQRLPRGYHIHSVPKEGYVLTCPDLSMVK